MTGGDKTKQKLDHQGQVDVYLRIVVKKFGNETFLMLWAVVVAQLVEQLLPKPEVRGSNPVMGKMY